MNNNEVRFLFNQLSQFDFTRQDLQLGNTLSEPVVIVQKSQRGQFFSKSNPNEDSDLIKVISTLSNKIKDHPDLSQERDFIANVIKLSDQLLHRAELLKNPVNAHGVQEKVADLVSQLALDCWNNSDQSLKQILDTFPFGGWKNVLACHFKDEKGKVVVLNETLYLSTASLKNKTKKNPKEKGGENDRTTIQAETLDSVKKILNKNTKIQWIHIQGMPPISRQKFELCLIPCSCFFEKEMIAVNPLLILQSPYLQQLAQRAKKNKENVQFSLPTHINPNIFRQVNENPTSQSIEYSILKFFEIDELGTDFIEKQIIPIELSREIMGHLSPADHFAVATTSKGWNQTARESSEEQFKSFIDSLIQGIDSEKYPALVEKLNLCREKEITDFEATIETLISELSLLEDEDVKELQDFLTTRSLKFFKDVFEWVKIEKLANTIDVYPNFKIDVFEDLFNKYFYRNKLEKASKLLDVISHRTEFNKLYIVLDVTIQISLEIEKNIELGIDKFNNLWRGLLRVFSLSIIKKVVHRLVNNSILHKSYEDFNKARAFIEKMTVIDEELKKEILNMDTKELHEWSKDVKIT